MWKTWPSLALSLAIGIAFAVGGLAIVGGTARARMMPINEQADSPTTRALRETLAKLTNQSGPTESVEKATHFVRRQLDQTNIRTGKDYLLAAQILARGSSATDALLAHDLACCALALGESESKSVVATAMDQYLARTGNSQRFGTQEGVPVDGEAVTSGMRFILGVGGVQSSQRESHSIPASSNPGRNSIGF